MASIAFFSLLLLLLSAHGAAPALGFTRSDFPRDFVFGAATSAYQDDVKLMADTNLEAYRFSISWSRLIPNGRGAVNPKGLEYYNNLIDELVQYGIQVHIMIYQLDYPQILEDEYGGWLSHRIVEDFTEFADICFREFGDRVSYWTTIDEPNVGAIGSYDGGILAPGHCSDPFGITKCTIGDSTVEPYIAAHNMLLAHASATRLYREKYQAVQKGFVGLNIYSLWPYPFSNSTVDLEATKRCMDFTFGWYVNFTLPLLQDCRASQLVVPFLRIIDPLMSGDYPETMKKIVGSRLPAFTRTQSEAIIGSVDFIGINHYFSVYVNDRPLDKGVRDYTADLSITYKTSKTDPPTGKFPPSSYPTDSKGLQLVLMYLKEACGDIPIYIQENGNASSNDTLDDTDRLEYLKSYIGGTLAALRNGANVKGYFTWAFLDVFEFLAGCQSRYGLYRVDFDDEALPRHARVSARWYSAFLKNNGIHVQSELNNRGSRAEQ